MKDVVFTKKLGSYVVGRVYSLKDVAADFFVKKAKIAEFKTDDFSDVLEPSKESEKPVSKKRGRKPKNTYQTRELIAEE